MAIFRYLGLEALFLGERSPASIVLGLLLSSPEDDGPVTDLRSKVHVR